MSDIDSIDEAEYLSACGGDEPRNVSGDYIQTVDARSEGGNTWQSLVTAVEEAEGRPWESEVEEVQEERIQHIPGAFPCKGENHRSADGHGLESSGLTQEELLAGMIGAGLQAGAAPAPIYPDRLQMPDANDIFESERNPWGLGSDISQVASAPLERDIPNELYGRPRSATDGVRQPRRTRGLGRVSFEELNNNLRRQHGGTPRSGRREQAGPTPRTPWSSPSPNSSSQFIPSIPTQATFTPGKNDSGRSRTNGAASSRPSRHGSGIRRTSGTTSGVQPAANSTMSPSRNDRSRSHTGSTVRSDSGSRFGRFDTYTTVSAQSSNEESTPTLKGLCWGRHVFKPWKKRGR